MTDEPFGLAEYALVGCLVGVIVIVLVILL
jgi:hypothetical protein